MATAPPEIAAPATRAGTYRFDEFTLDVVARKLLRGDTATALPSRAFDALVYLIEHRERLVQKNELIDAIWSDVVVTDDSLTHAVSVVRRALADERGHPKYIETVPRRGYRFIGVVRADEVERSAEQVTSEPVAVPVIAQAAAPSSPRPKPARLAWVAAGTAAFAVLIALVALLAPPAPSLDVAARSVWLSQPSPPEASIASGGVLSPDGRYLAFVARDDLAGKNALWVRSLQSNALERLPETDDASKPFWSPDSRRIGFFASGKLMTVDTASRAVVNVAAVDVVVAGGTWVGSPGTELEFAL